MADTKRVIIGSENDDTLKVDLIQVGSKVVLPVVLFDSSGNFTNSPAIQYADGTVDHSASKTNLMSWKNTQLGLDEILAVSVVNPLPTSNPTGDGLLGDVVTATDSVLETVTTFYESFNSIIGQEEQTSSNPMNGLALVYRDANDSNKLKTPDNVSNGFPVNSLGGATELTLTDFYNYVNGALQFCDTSNVGFGDDYINGATQNVATSGNVANAAAVATLSGGSVLIQHVTGFQITYSGAIAASVVVATLTGLVGGVTFSYVIPVPVGALVVGTPIIVNFPKPIRNNAPGTSIVLTVPALGAGNTNCCANLFGFYTA